VSIFNLAASLSGVPGLRVSLPLEAVVSMSLPTLSAGCHTLTPTLLHFAESSRLVAAILAVEVAVALPACGNALSRGAGELAVAA